MGEVITLGETVLTECTDDEVRANMIQFLCLAYMAMNEPSKVRTLAEKMPNVHLSSEELFMHILKGTELYELKQQALFDYTDIVCRHLSTLNIRLNNCSVPYTINECIALQQKTLDVLNIFFEDGDYGFYHVRIKGIYRNMALLSMTEAQNTIAALKHLQLAAQHAIAFDTNYDSNKKHTSIVSRGHSFGKVAHSQTGNQSYDLIASLENNVFDPIRSDEAFIAIEKLLRKHAKDK